MKKGIKYLIIILGLSFGLSGCKEEKDPFQNRPRVLVETTERTNVEIYGNYVGKIRASQSIEIRARVSGFLEQVHFLTGRLVQKNSLLFTIDQSQYIAHFDRSKAELAKANAEKARAKRDLDRIKPLYEQNAASRQDYDNAQAAYELSIAEIEIAKANLEQAELELSFTKIRAPYTGYITVNLADEGALVGPNGKSLLAHLLKIDTVFVDFNMTALDYLNAKRRNVDLSQQDTTSFKSFTPTATITLPDNSNYPYKGTLNFANPLIDAETGTFTVEAVLPNPEVVLLPGQFTSVKLLTDVYQGAVLVPQKALLISEGGSNVYVVKGDSSFEKRFIELGPLNGNDIIAERGLFNNERIIVEGINKLSGASKVVPYTLADSAKFYQLKVDAGE